MNAFRVVFHVTCYYSVWLTSVLSAAYGKDGWGPSLLAVLLILQYAWEAYHKTRGLSYRFICLLSLLGIIVDSLLMQVGLITFKANFYPMGLCPLWMMAIWVSFSVLVDTCLRSFFSRSILLGILSFIGFPIAYFAGAKLGAAHFPAGDGAVLIIGVIWGFLLPLVLYGYPEFV